MEILEIIKNRPATKTLAGGHSPYFLAKVKGGQVTHFRKPPF